MSLVFKYSLIEEIKNFLDITFHGSGYKHLISVVYPSVSKFAVSEKRKIEIINELNSVWPAVEPQFVYALKYLGFTNFSLPAVCYIHFFGCEGWINIDKKQIHVRVEESSVCNTINSIMHETLHLITFQEDLSYEERETIVEDLMNSPSIQDILSKI
jgi:hypothetical protein